VSFLFCFIFHYFVIRATSQRFVENFLASNQWLQTPVGGSVGNLDEALAIENGTNNDEVTVVTRECFCLFIFIVFVFYFCSTNTKCTS
jgi:hypothetical protein